MEDRKAPRWGTKEWIAAYPWSRMDRKRRRRAERVVGKELVDDLRAGPFTCCILTRMEHVMEKYGAKVPKPKGAQQRLERALVEVSRFERDLYDAAFAAALAGKWGLA